MPLIDGYGMKKMIAKSPSDVVRIVHGTKGTQGEVMIGKIYGAKRPGYEKAGSLRTRSSPFRNVLLLPIAHIEYWIFLLRNPLKRNEYLVSKEP